MPPDLRRAWAALFHHYVFDAGDDDFSHLPPHRRGLLDRFGAGSRAEDPEPADRKASALTGRGNAHQK